MIAPRLGCCHIYIPDLACILQAIIGIEKEMTHQALLWTSAKAEIAIAEIAAEIPSASHATGEAVASPAAGPSSAPQEAEAVPGAASEALPAERRESVAEPEGAAAAPEGSATAPPRGAVVYQGWIHSREPTLRALWHRRWAVARQGRLDLYENETMAKIVSTVPLQQCRVEKLVVQDSRLQDGCDFEHGIRVVLGKGLGFGKEKLLATTSEGEQNGWGGALMSCRQGVLEVAAPATAPQVSACSEAVDKKEHVNETGAGRQFGENLGKVLPIPPGPRLSGSKKSGFVHHGRCLSMQSACDALSAWSRWHEGGLVRRASRRASCTVWAPYRKSTVCGGWNESHPMRSCSIDESLVL